MNGAKIPDPCIIRAEENSVMIFRSDTGRTALFSGPELEALGAWAKSGEHCGFIARLEKLGLADDAIRPAVLAALAESAVIHAPKRSFAAPESLHIELTERCPLHCPQCYKERGEAELSNQLLCRILHEAAEMKVFQIALGGGEPLCYPQLAGTVELIRCLGMACSITSSGAGLTAKLAAKLKTAGANHIQISLNGSTEAVNSRSRDGFAEALNALELLRKAGLPFGVNFVARRDNISDFPAVAELAKRAGADNINLLRCKPSPNENFEACSPAPGQLLALAETVREFPRGGDFSVKVDSAFSNLLCHLHGKPGKLTGCGAGRRFAALDARGNFRPCSHAGRRSPAGSLAGYWRESKELELFRSREDSAGSPCRECKYLSGCRGCAACMLSAEGETCAFYQNTNQHIA